LASARKLAGSRVAEDTSINDNMVVAAQGAELTDGVSVAMNMTPVGRMARRAGHSDRSEDRVGCEVSSSAACSLSRARPNPGQQSRAWA